MVNRPLEERVAALVLEYAQASGVGQPLNQKLSLRSDLGIESLALVSLAVRLGEDFGVDIAERGAELGKLQTVADLIALAGVLQQG